MPTLCGRRGDRARCWSEGLTAKLKARVSKGRGGPKERERAKGAWCQGARSPKGRVVPRGAESQTARGPDGAVWHVAPFGTMRPLGPCALWDHAHFGTPRPLGFRASGTSALFGPRAFTRSDLRMPRGVSNELTTHLLMRPQEGKTTICEHRSGPAWPPQTARRAPESMSSPEGVSRRIVGATRTRRTCPSHRPPPIPTGQCLKPQRSPLMKA
jgi:hypothetical protein